MNTFAIGRCPFPARALKYGKPMDESDQAVIVRSRALPAGVFHGLVELCVAEGRYDALQIALTDGGWKRYDPPRRNGGK